MNTRESTIPPPPLCFSCGNDLPEGDFDLFHELVDKYVYEGIEENAAEKMVLDGFIPDVLEKWLHSNEMKILKLSKIYHKQCCRIMFQGDALEYRKGMALYEGAPLSNVPK
jgi:hypothetical protein